MKRGLILGLLAVAGCARSSSDDVEQRTAAVTAPRYRLVDLGTLGGPSSHAFALNEKTQVVGTSKTVSGADHCFLWDAGTLTDLGHLGGNRCTARAINDSGLIVGASRTGDGHDHAFLYKDATMADLGTLGATGSDALFINEAGQIAGTLEGSGLGLCFFYEVGVMTDVRPGTDCFPGGLNDAGQIVGETHSFDSGTQQPFLYKSGDGFAVLAGIPSIIATDAKAINDAGVFAGSFEGPEGRRRVYYYKDGSRFPLDGPPDFNAVPLGIDDAGRVVVQFIAVDKGGTSYRALWDGAALLDLRPFEPQESNAAGHVAGSANDRAAVYRDGTVIDLGAAAPSMATNINEAGAMIGFAPFVNPITGDTEEHAALWIPLAPDGTPCLHRDECASEACIDGVCCDTPCGFGATNDCQACSAAAGAPVDGICSILPSSHVCRAAAATDLCDVAEVCAGGPDCPADAFAGTSVQCYTRPHLCASVEEKLFCTSAGPSCPTPTPWDATDCMSTPNGSNVSVSLGGGSTEPGGATLTFPTISTTSGNGETAIVSQGTGCPPGSGFQVLGTGITSSTGEYWNIDTTATYAGRIRICLNYDQGGMVEAGPIEQSLRIMHGSADDCGASWSMLLNQTIPPHMSINEICADTPSLSPFAIVAPIFFGVPDTEIAFATSTAGAAVAFPLPEANYIVGGPQPVVCTPAPGATFAPGQTTVNCTSADTAGTPSATSFTVWVQYQAPSDGTFFLPPIDPDGDRRFKRGSTIPVKFRLQGASARITNLAARLYVASVSNGVVGPYEEAESTPACDGNAFRYDAGARQYVFNLSTKKMTAGTWSLRADLGDRVDHSLIISLR